MRYDPVLHIVLHEPEIPPNAGNVGRTCVAIGAKMWLVKPLGFKLDDYYLRRAGLDYWDDLEWEAVDSWDHLLAALAAVGRQPNWLFSARATRPYTDVAATLEQANALHAAGAGVVRIAVDSRSDAAALPAIRAGTPANLAIDLQAAHAERLLTIPSRPQVRSLNLANCAAIVAYEAVRQWGGGV
ncbi:MAG: tRNA (uridine(34)/cytosine(34)/5-carboxymethylaminomethyluridine(34)-2'-O)-methyltransferase TrmL [Planctomycetia bacterium]|nr:tRNA (uridine(34)/cytosine(34)/5-carboxymethylaminomethyluridine(34)-2'-O)-methyltransferase TrmL [Planctomycetia bacterium]